MICERLDLTDSACAKHGYGNPSYEFKARPGTTTKLNAMIALKVQKIIPIIVECLRSRMASVTAIVIGDRTPYIPIPVGMVSSANRAKRSVEVLCSTILPDFA